MIYVDLDYSHTCSPYSSAFIDQLYEASMTIASGLLQRHFQTLVNDNMRWQMLIDDNIVWELAYAAAIGHSTRLSGRA